MSDVKVKTFVGKSLHDWEFEMSLNPNVDILAEVLADKLSDCNPQLYAQHKQLLTEQNLATYYKTAILTRAVACQRKDSGYSFGKLTSDQRNSLHYLVLTDGLKLITDSLGYVQDDERSYKYLPTATIDEADFKMMMDVSKKLELFTKHGLGAQKDAMTKDHNGREAVMTNYVSGDDLVGAKDCAKDGTDLVIAYVLGLSVSKIMRNDFTEELSKATQSALEKTKGNRIPLVNEEVPWADAVLASVKSLQEEISAGGWLI